MGPADPITANLQRVRERIYAAAAACGRDPGTICLLAVSKTVPAAAIRIAQASGQLCFGESYLNEALEKMAVLSDPRPEWHFIGPLQSNKTRRIAEHFDWVHSVDRLAVARRLSAQRPVGLKPLQICLQINISHEPSKAGMHVTELPKVAETVAELPHLRLRGLMAIPAPTLDDTAQREAFRQLRQALEELNARGMRLDTLSMGMSGDLEAAIAEGATIVRVGSAIFGSRPARRTPGQSAD